MMAKWGVVLSPKAHATEATEKKLSIEELVPTIYHSYLDIFTKPTISQLLPPREWDLEVKLVKNAPKSIVTHL
jgi:hypothetical protein